MASDREKGEKRKEPEGPESVRIDRWLWAARCFKSRTQATTACEGGHVKLDGRRAKPSGAVRVGDSIELWTPRGTRIFRVERLAIRRGPTSVARALYEDLTPAPAETAPARTRVRAGKPSRKDRRLGRERKQGFEGHP